MKVKIQRKPKQTTAIGSPMQRTFSGSAMGARMDSFDMAYRCFPDFMSCASRLSATRFRSNSCRIVR